MILLVLRGERGLESNPLEEGATVEEEEEEEIEGEGGEAEAEAEEEEEEDEEVGAVLKVTAGEAGDMGVDGWEA